MVKDVSVTFISVKYSGKSIGDDIRIEWEALTQFGGFNIKIKNGITRQLNQKLGVFPVDQSSFALPITLRVIERDFVFNDVGTQKLKLNVDLSSTTPKTDVYQIKVAESRLKYKRAEALFDLKLEIQVVDAIRYLSEQDDGWLHVLFDGKVRSLPAFLRVRFEHSDAKREYFTILEGSYQGQLASVKFDKDGNSFLLAGNHQIGTAKLKYSISKKILTFKDKNYVTKDYPSSPWIKGIHDIEIPDAPHRGGMSYLDVAKKATVWFRIGHDGERYIHTGRASLGCITLTEHKKWDDLYDLLIKSRKGDSVSIGILEVID